MTEYVTVPAGDSAGDTANLLLAAAQEKGYDASVVSTTTDGPEGLAFSAPADVAKAAKVDVHEEPSFDEQLKADEKAAQEALDQRSDVAPATTDDSPEVSEEKPPAKKAAKKTAKKSTAKKTAK